MKYDDLKIVAHIGTDDPEMQAMTDLNTFAPQRMSQHRQAEANVLCDPVYKAKLRAKGIQLIGYEDLLKNQEMQRPFVSDKYEDVVKKASEKRGAN